ncbi:hypothetical protein [Litorisediminicola beolgyonensis]|uniref:Uncharacterized protein n=1 Tax=Litorisediminicola beolgyonensis TaxID=1173614 RepID=A0ABW3ZFT1_9RHOB
MPRKSRFVASVIATAKSTKTVPVFSRGAARQAMIDRRDSAPKKLRA